MRTLNKEYLGRVKQLFFVPVNPCFKSLVVIRFMIYFKSKINILKQNIDFENSQIM